MTVLVELARRALAHPQTSTFVKRAVNAADNSGHAVVDPFDVPIWGIVLLYATIFGAAVGISLMSYMLNSVIVTLCMLESPTAAITLSSTPSTTTVSDKEDASEKETLLETGPTVTLVTQKPITSSIRGTIRHLVAHAGRFARFRGFKLNALYSLLSGLTATFFSGALPNVPGQTVLSAALTGALLANVHAAWTHKVIGMPTPTQKTAFLASVPARQHWKRLAVPAALKAVMPYVSLYLTAGVFMLLRLDQVEAHAPASCAQTVGLVARFLAVAVFGAACSLFLCLPAMVTLARIEASLLPEDQDTIVPFDRTFGGKVVSRIMGGAGAVGFLDAWRSFNWEARRRLIGLMVKNFFIVVGAVVVLAHVVVLEVFVIKGPEVLRGMH